jgi:uncharacterized Zn finger protein
MSYWGFPKYVSVAEKRVKAAKKLEKLKEKRDVKPVVLQGKAIARTWWGKAWNENLERYADYENRIGRGRSYVRHGAVLDLQIREGEVVALVQGSQSNPYEVVITINKLAKDAWKNISDSCAGMIESLSELMAGKFPKAMAEAFMGQGTGLFPTSKEIRLRCSCPDSATMCKHVAASLYGVGARLDEDPSLFFSLRGVDTSDLISRTIVSGTERLLSKAGKKSARIISDADLSAVFGIELAEGAVASTHKAAPSRKLKAPETEKKALEKKAPVVKKAKAGLKKKAAKKQPAAARKKTTKKRLKKA